MSLKTILADGKALLEDGDAKVRQFLDEHMTQLTQLGDLVEDNRIIASAEAALHAPRPVLDAIADVLDAIAAQYTRPGS
jgi:hypothetical protein